MAKKTRSITLSAMLSALAVISLFIASVWPTGLYGLVACSSLFVAAAVIEMGAVQGVCVYVAAAALGMLLLANKSAPLLFVLFFGYYPIVKRLIEKTGVKPLQWFLKLAVFNASLTIIWFSLRATLLSFEGQTPAFWVLCLLGSLVFLIFDFGYSKLLRFYADRISIHNKRF